LTGCGGSKSCLMLSLNFRYLSRHYIAQLCYKVMCAVTFSRVRKFWELSLNYSTNVKRNLAWAYFNYNTEQRKTWIICMKTIISVNISKGRLVELRSDFWFVCVQKAKEGSANWQIVCHLLLKVFISYQESHFLSIHQFHEVLE